jgi:uncharacterized protein YigE (DUF2233 family)
VSMSGLVRRGAVVLAAIAIGAGAAWLALRREPLPPGPDLADLPGECAVVTHEGSRHVVCEIDPRRDEITVRHTGPDGKAFGSLDAFAAATRAAGRPVGLAMNAGMYHEDMSPVGLLVEDDRELSPLATGEGAGNFFLKPNGVFLIDADGKAAVMETAAYAAAGLSPRFATQSGPMLVIDGALHPKLLPDGESRHVRNGVGVRPDGTVALAISLDPVSLGRFARLFRDALGCPHALFFDGAISALTNGERTLLGGEFPVGPILAVTARPATAP